MVPFIQSVATVFVPFRDKIKLALDKAIAIQTLPQVAKSYLGIGFN